MTGHCYVIQYRTRDGSWVPLDKAPFDTQAQAKELLALMPDRDNCRIAEAHTVTLYKPVKEAQEAHGV